MLNINMIPNGSALTIALEGSLDTFSSPRLDAELRGALDGVTSLVMDLEGLEYISSAGLRVFLFAYKTMKRQGEMTIIHVRDVIYKVFEVSGFINILNIQETPADRQEGLEQKGKELTLEAKIANNERFTDFANAELEAMGCPMKAQLQIDTAIDEILANVASYAYGEGTGTVSLMIRMENDPKMAVIRFTDGGIPFNPLETNIPDTTALPADDRPIGGLGIFLVRKLMDDVAYEHRDGKNILTLKKRI